MKKLILGVMLGCLLMAVAGCGGGGTKTGGGGDIPIDPDGSGTPGGSTTSVIKLNVTTKQPIGVYYQVTNSSGDTMMAKVTDITVSDANASTKIFTVWCEWSLVRKTTPEAVEVWKMADSPERKGFYMKDNTGKAYYHTSGTGAAYNQVKLTTSSVQSGSFKFTVANAAALSSICFYDADYGVTTNSIMVTSN